MGVDQGGFYLVARFSNEDPGQVREMLRLLQNPEGRAEVESYDGEHVVLIRHAIPGL